MTPQRGADTGSLRDVIIGIRGANPIQCELLLQAFTGWTSNVPDRDSQAWVVSRRLWQRVENPEDIAWLGEQVRGTDPCASRAAIRVLGRSPSSAARSFLLSGLADPDPTVRRLAAFGIGFREDSTANAQLVRLLRDGDAGVRAAAAWALGAVN
jgi:HEAT repeat protein